MSEISADKVIELASRMDQGIGGEICAAIAMALEKYSNDEVHDQESFVLTIKPEHSAWAMRQTTLRALPERRK